MRDGDLQRILAQAPVGFASVEGPDMVFTAANALYEEMVSRHGLVGCRWADVFPELVDTPTHAALRAAYQGERIHVHEHLVPLTRDGVPHDCYYTFTLDPLRDEDGAVTGFVVIANEVTEIVAGRRRAEALAAQLAVREARYRLLVGEMDEGFTLIELRYDAAGRPVDFYYLEANDAYCRQTGTASPVGMTVREQIPSIEQSLIDQYAEVARTGAPLRFQVEVGALGKWFDVFAGRIGDAALHQVGIIFKDITAQRAAELEREQLLAAEQVARRDAERANQLKDQFLATVSHELRSPLHAMLGWLRILRSENLDASREEHALSVIERNARSQAQLVEDLLDVTRIMEGKLRLDLQATDLDAIIDGAVDSLRPMAEARGVTIVRPAEPSGQATVDAHRVEQVLWNLISNAVKFTPTNGVVTVEVARTGAGVELAVIDTGMGIAPDFLPHVFERFRQADGSSTRKHGGLGLGLSIVRQLVELHGGTVSVHSEGEGRGTRFTVRLPSEPPRAELPAVERRITPSTGEAALDPPPELAGMRILVVDDEADARETIRRLLSAVGAHVTAAGSAREALDVLRAERPALLLSDIGMPGEDGYALMAAVRALPVDEGGETPAIAVTAFARAQDRTRAIRAGFQSHVPKPIEPAELFAVIASLVRA